MKIKLAHCTKCYDRGLHELLWESRGGVANSTSGGKSKRTLRKISCVLKNVIRRAIAYCEMILFPHFCQVFSFLSSNENSVTMGYISPSVSSIEILA